MNLETTYTDIESTGNVCGVEYITAIAHYKNGCEQKCTLRKSELNLHTTLQIIQKKYNIDEDNMKILIESFDTDCEQKKLESEID